MAGLQDLIAGRIQLKKPCDYDVDDYQQDTLEQLLLKHDKEILGTGTPDVSQCFLRMTEVIYRELKSKFTSLLGSVKFEVPAFVFGGVLINEDGGKGSSIELRHALRLEHGTMEDVTHSFIEATEAKFKELQSGNQHAFN